MALSFMSLSVIGDLKVTDQGLIDVDLGDFDDAEAARVDELRQAAGTKARAKVIAFIKRHIPEDSADAFTAAEIAAMNGRRNSTDRFEPYAAS